MLKDQINSMLFWSCPNAWCNGLVCKPKMARRLGFEILWRDSCRKLSNLTRPNMFCINSSHIFLLLPGFEWCFRWFHQSGCKTCFLLSKCEYNIICSIRMWRFKHKKCLSQISALWDTSILNFQNVVGWIKTLVFEWRLYELFYIK